MKSWLLSVSMVLVLVVGAFCEDQGESAAKSFKAASGEANIYVARKTEIMGALIDFLVVLDGTETVTLKGGTYAFFAVPAGTHKVEVKAGVGSAVIEVNASEGKNYFFETGAKPKKALLEPEMAQVIFEPMGRLMVSQAKYAKPMSQ